MFSCPNRYTQYMKDVQCVAFIVPPKVQPDTKRGNPFQLTFELCMNSLLEQRWKRKLETKQSLKNSEIVILLPSSDPTLVPDSIRSAPRFCVPSDYPLIHQHIVELILCPRIFHFRIRLPSLLLGGSRKATDLNFYKHLKQVQETAIGKDIEQTRHFIEIEKSPLLSEEADDGSGARAIQLKSKLDAEFGQEIPSVTTLV